MVHINSHSMQMPCILTLNSQTFMFIKIVWLLYHFKEQPNKFLWLSPVLGGKCGGWYVEESGTTLSSYSFSQHGLACTGRSNHQYTLAHSTEKHWDPVKWSHLHKHIVVRQSIMKWILARISYALSILPNGFEYNNLYNTRWISTLINLPSACCHWLMKILLQPAHIVLTMLTCLF